jgi:hypothetical protein
MRKTIDAPCPLEGRDKNKTYVLTEWPARKAARWGVRASIALARAGTTLAPDFKPGMGPLVQVGGIGSMLMYVDSDEVCGLLDELMECVQFKTGKDGSFVRGLAEEDIEDPATVLWLQQEVFALHTGFTLAELKSRLTSALKEKLSWIIQTFQQKSGQSSQQDERPLSS